MVKLEAFYHPFLWKIKPHTGEKGNKYFLDVDIKGMWVMDSIKKVLGENLVLRRAKPLTWEDFELVHDGEYISKVQNGKIQYSWVSWSKSFLRAQLYNSGVIYTASLDALKKKTIVSALVVEGHHAKKNSGSGFCTFNHMVVVIKKLLREKRLAKIAVIDLDYHLGDGTLDILGKEKNIHIFDIYGGTHKEYVSKDKISSHNKVNKAGSVKEYFQILEGLETFLKSAKPDLVFFVAGVDVYIHDRYKGIEGFDIKNIQERDRLALGLLAKNNLPTVITLGGGYINYLDSKSGVISDNLMRKRRSNLVKLHVNTLNEAFKTIRDANKK